MFVFTLVLALSIASRRRTSCEMYCSGDVLLTDAAAVDADASLAPKPESGCCWSPRIIVLRFKSQSDIAVPHKLAKY